MQDIIDRENPTSVDLWSSDNEGSCDSEPEEAMPPQVNLSYDQAMNEFNSFYLFRLKKYRPKFDNSKSTVLSGMDEDGNVRKIALGPVVERGMDLASGRNLADYLCPKTHRMDVLRFIYDHRETHPTFFKLCQCEASRKPVEVSCERFLGLAGYTSAPRRTRLGVRTYERLAILSCILQDVYIDVEWCAEEYLRRCKNGSWNEKEVAEAMKCWNLERILAAERFGRRAPEMIEMEEFSSGGHGQS